MSTRKYPEDFMNKIICGNSLSVMREMPAKVIDMVVCSPPYWGLRDYGTGPDQLGLEPTPEMYIEHLTEIFNEVKRVLKKEGTLWLNIGDTYGGSGGAGGDYNVGGLREGQSRFKQGKTKFQPKCLLMIPERLAWSLIQNGWILRNKIVWYKPNAMPSSVTDRFSNRWEYIYLFSKSQRYYFDLDAVREPFQEGSLERLERGVSETHKYIGLPNYGGGGGLNKPRPHIKTTKIPKDGAELFGSPRARYNREGYDDRWNPNPDGKNPGDVFEINTQPFPEAHFAVFPEKLCEKPIKAGCPEQVCKKCGKARERISETNYIVTGSQKGKKQQAKEWQVNRPYEQRKEAFHKTIGWTSCKCNAGFEGGIALDPFCGAGTALLVAKEMRRRFIGIDIKQEYCDMAKTRLAQGVL